MKVATNTMLLGQRYRRAVLGHTNGFAMTISLVELPASCIQEYCMARAEIRSSFPREECGSTSYYANFTDPSANEPYASKKIIRLASSLHG